MTDIGIEAQPHPLRRSEVRREVRAEDHVGRHWFQPRRGWFSDTGWRHLVLIAACLFGLFPLAWVISASVNPVATLHGQAFIPRQPTLDNYRTLLSGDTVPFVRWLTNTVIVASVVAIGQVFVSAFAANAFSRMRFKGRRLGLLTILLVQMFPQALAMVAIFLFMVNIRGLFPAIGVGTITGLILVYLGGSLGVNTWLMKGFFDTIPIELDESAMCDGAGHGQIFFRIVLPLAAPVLAVIGLLSFIFTINEFILASVLLQNVEHFTAAVGLQGYISERYGARWGPFTAGALMTGIPVVVLFLFLQRFLVSGLTSGAVKG